MLSSSTVVLPCSCVSVASLKAHSRNSCPDCRDRRLWSETHRVGQLAIPEHTAGLCAGLCPHTLLCSLASVSLLCEETPLCGSAAGFVPPLSLSCWCPAEHRCRASSCSSRAPCRRASAKEAVSHLLCQGRNLLLP